MGHPTTVLQILAEAAPHAICPPPETLAKLHPAAGEIRTVMTNTPEGKRGAVHASFTVATRPAIPRAIRILSTVAWYAEANGYLCRSSQGTLQFFRDNTREKHDFWLHLKEAPYGSGRFTMQLLFPSRSCEHLQFKWADRPGTRLEERVPTVVERLRTFMRVAEVEERENIAAGIAREIAEGNAKRLAVERLTPSRKYQIWTAARKWTRLRELKTFREDLLRHDITVPDLDEYIRQLRREVRSLLLSSTNARRC